MPLYEEARLRAAHAATVMRADTTTSLREAAREAQTDPRTVLKYFPRSFTRDLRGRYRIAAADREPFQMLVVSEEQGVVVRTIRGSHKRALLGAHHNAIRVYLGPGGGNAEVLTPFEGRTVAGLTFLADPDRLAALWHQGQFDFLEIYVLGR